MHLSCWHATRLQTEQGLWQQEGWGEKPSGGAGDRLEGSGDSVWPGILSTAGHRRGDVPNLDQAQVMGGHRYDSCHKSLRDGTKAMHAPRPARSRRMLGGRGTRTDLTHRHCKAEMENNLSQSAGRACKQPPDPGFSVLQEECKPFETKPKLF